MLARTVKKGKKIRPHFGRSINKRKRNRRVGTVELKRRNKEEMKRVER
jgi:hypothetical protein